MTELILRAKDGDGEAMNELISQNVGLVWNIVRRFANRGYELDDLFQIGSMGFVKAIKRFDLNFETQLSTYAVSMIIGEIKRFLRDDGMIKVSRSLKETAAKVREIEKNDPDKDFTLEELSEKLGIERQDIVMALDATMAVDSLERQISDEKESRTVGEGVACNKNEYDELLDKITVGNMLECLSEKERKVIIYRFYREMTQAKVAEIFGTSQVQISRIEKKALCKMKCANVDK